MSKDELRTLLAQARQQVWEEAIAWMENSDWDYKEMIAGEMREQAKKGQP